MRLLGEVQAGRWVEALQLPKSEQLVYGIPMPSAKYANKMFLLRAIGDSMNQANVPDQSLLICVHLDDFTKHWRELRSGDKVVVYRTRKDGLYEATVKELDIRPEGTFWVVPKSDNPEHMPIKLPPPDQWPDQVGQNHEISVQAVVLGRALQMFVD